MTVLIIGTGNMARGISILLQAGGHDVRLYNPERAKAESLASELNSAPVGQGKVSVTAALGDAIAASEVVILASWYGVNLETAREHAAELEGKVVVDISNPLNDTYDGLVTEGGPSAAENIQAVLPASAKVVKAFNTTFAGTLLGGHVADHALDVFLAGENKEAKEAVALLVTGGGLEAIDAGGLERARQLEAIGFLGIVLQSRLDGKFMTAWKLVRPQPGHAAS